jgi:hypothetical protein
MYSPFINYFWSNRVRSEERLPQQIYEILTIKKTMGGKMVYEIRDLGGKCFRVAPSLDKENYFSLFANISTDGKRLLVPNGHKPKNRPLFVNESDTLAKTVLVIAFLSFVLAVAFELWYIF